MGEILVLETPHVVFATAMLHVASSLSATVDCISESHWEMTYRSLTTLFYTYLP